MLLQFGIVDDDDGGTIEPKEFGDAMRHIGILLDADGLEALFAHIDVNGNGHIDIDEWTLMMKGLLSKLQRRGTTEDVTKALQSILGSSADSPIAWEVRHLSLFSEIFSRVFA